MTMADRVFPRAVESGIGVPVQPRGPRLSAREIEILAMVAQGLGDVQIARHLGVSVGGVRYCVRNCLVKLGAVNRPHAIALAMALGLIDPRLP